MTGPGDLQGPANLQAAGDRIEEVLDRLGSLPDRRARLWAEELLRLVLDLYGAGLERIVDLACDDGVPGGPPLLERLGSDELVAGLLVVHDLHPLGLRSRVERALAEIRGALGDGDVRLLELDEERAAVRVRLLAPARSAPQAMEDHLRRLIEAAAPELVAVDVERPSQVPLGAPRHDAPQPGRAAAGGPGTPVGLRRTVEAGQ